MKCGECRFWGDGEDMHPEFRQCTAVVFDKYKETNRAPADHWDADEIQEHAEMVAHKAVVVDGSVYLAALRTRDDFGCVLFEAKPLEETR